MTAETHRANIMHKLGLHSIAELVHYAVAIRLLRREDFRGLIAPYGIAVRRLLNPLYCKISRIVRQWRRIRSPELLD